MADKMKVDDVKKLEGRLGFKDGQLSSHDKFYLFKMDDTIKNMKKGKHFKRGIVINNLESLKKHRASYGTLDDLDRSRIFITDSSLIDKSRLRDKKYLE